MRRAWIATLALVLAGCVDFEALPTDGSPQVGGAAVNLTLDLVQPVDGPDTLGVHGWVGARLGGLRFVDDTLRVKGQAVAPRDGRGEVARFYEGVLVLAPGALGPGAVEVRLPKPVGVEFIPATFQAPLWMRRGPARLAVAPGADLVFEIATGPAPAELVGGIGTWRLEIDRGGKFLNLLSSGSVPARIVIPGASVPDDTSRTIRAELRVSRLLRRNLHPDSARVEYRGNSTVHWTVDVVP
ncbi:MAG TPA: hypothetical protein VF613_14825 [Longimicrobium sp.]|jgi:hypothetical protein